MSIVVNNRLFFPIEEAGAALGYLPRLLTGEDGRVVVISLPEGGAYAVPVREHRGRGTALLKTLKPGVSFGWYGSWFTLTARRKRKLAWPVVDRWGEERRLRVVEEAEPFLVQLGIHRGDRFLEISFSNDTDDQFKFDTPSFRAQVDGFYQSCHGVAAAEEGAGDWFVPGDRRRKINLPDGFDEHEEGRDALVAVLMAIAARDPAGGAG